MSKRITYSDGVTEVVGLDVSDVSSRFVRIDGESGEVLGEGSVDTSQLALTAQFGGRLPARVAIEAGSHSAWISRLLSEMGHEVIIANPRQVSLISRSKQKSDRLDSIVLARLARMDAALLYPIRHRSKQAQLDLALLRSRDFLVSNRTRLINHVRGVVKPFGESLPRCSSAAFPERAKACLSVALQELVAPFLEDIATATERIRALDRKVVGVVEERYPEAKQLSQVKGVGPITSLAYVLTIEEASRFKQSRDVAAYLGLTPRQRQSGGSNPQLHITKAGDNLVRKLLVQAAHYILGPFGEPSALRAWGLRLAGEQGEGTRLSSRGRKRAVTAVARKLAVLLHRLWRSGAVYEPLRGMRLKPANAM